MLPISPEVLVMWTKAPLSCLRYWSAAARLTKKLPFRCTEITVSQSSAVMRWKIWSRSTPALLTTTSSPPKWSSAACTIFCAELHSATESVLIAAAPPAPSISCLVSSAGVAERPSPASEAPMSLISTLAPASAIAIAISRPMPPPAPVTAAILPSSIPAIDHSSVAARSNDEARARSTSRRQCVNVAGILSRTGGKLRRYLNPKKRKSPDARDADLWPLCRDPLRPDDAGAAGRLPHGDRDPWPAARPEQDLCPQPQAGEGDGAARGVFPHRLFVERARARDRRRDHQQQMAFDLPDQRA